MKIERATPPERYDHKAFKFYEPKISEVISSRKTPTYERILCSIPCAEEIDFLTAMQQYDKHLSQANLSPSTFVQRTYSSKFSAIYQYSRSSSAIQVILKTSDAYTLNMDLNIMDVNLSGLVNRIHVLLNNALNEEIESNSNFKIFNFCEDLRGSLPLPPFIATKLLIVRPNSTQKETAIIREGLLENIESVNKYDLPYPMIERTESDFECSICCEALADLKAFHILPCKFILEKPTLNLNN